MAPPATPDLNQLIQEKGFLDPNDAVAISFWIISIAMVASTVFFLSEAFSVSTHWKTSMHVSSLVTLVAAVHYFYMREFWVQVGASPILYRYIDWSITVPLQMIEFYLILAAVQPNISGLMFWRLLIGTVVMLAAGYCGEAGFVNAWIGFIVGMAGWGAILFEILMGGVDDSVLNLVYNLADLVNKIAFCLAIWAAAKKSTLAGKTEALLP